MKKKKFGIQVGFDFMYTSIPLSHSDLHLAEDWKVSWLTWVTSYIPEPADLLKPDHTNLVRRVSQITYKDIRNGGERAFLGGKDSVDNVDVCATETTGSRHVGFQILHQSPEVSKELCRHDRGK